MLDIMQSAGPVAPIMRTPRTEPFLADPKRRTGAAVRSTYEAMARLSGSFPSGAGSLLGVLLDAACSTGEQGRPVLRPLWAEEAMHRAYSMLRMVGRLYRRDPPSAGHGLCSAYSLARDLSGSLKSLEVEPDTQSVACSGVLRDVVCGLGTLFGPGVGDVATITHIERLALPAYQRRALVLAAGELVGNALLHAFPGRLSGRIAVSLTVLGPALARLRVTDDGIGFVRKGPNFHCGVAAGLADLLASDLAYIRAGGRTTAEIVFPVDRP